MSPVVTYAMGSGNDHYMRLADFEGNACWMKREGSDCLRQCSDAEAAQLEPAFQQVMENNRRQYEAIKINIETPPANDFIN